MTRWRMHRKFAVPVAAGVAALAVAGGAFAATGGILTDTGTDLPGSSPSTGEVLNIGAPDATTVAEKLTAGIPFAPGYGAYRSGELTLALTGASGQGPVGAAVTTNGSVKYQVASAAICSWAHYWVASAAAGNTAAAATAASEIEQSPAWVSTAATGLTGPTGLTAAIDAVEAGDVQLVRGMIDVGGMIGYGKCNALGPTAVIPAGMTQQQYHAQLAASRLAGESAILSDPTAAEINTQALDSPEMGAAVGTVLQRVDQSLVANLEQQASDGGSASLTTVGEQLVRDHPLTVYTAPSTGTTSAANQTASSAQGIGGIAVGAQLLGMPTSNLPTTLTELYTSSQEMQTAFKLAQQVFAVDPLAEILNTEPASS